MTASSAPAPSAAIGPSLPSWIIREATAHSAAAVRSEAGMVDRRPTERALGVFFDPAQTSLNDYARDDRAVVPDATVERTHRPGGGR